jgi:hypothetical protein
MFATLTFKEPVTDKNQASKYFKNLKDLMTKISWKKQFNSETPESPLSYIAPWERSANGSWHVHVLIYMPGWSVNQVKQLISGSIAKTKAPFGFDYIRWTYDENHSISFIKGRNAEIAAWQIAAYMTKYSEPKARLISYSQDIERKANPKFSFVGGYAKTYRRACATLDRGYKFFKDFYDNAPRYSVFMAVKAFMKKNLDELRNIFARNVPEECILKNIGYGAAMAERMQSKMKQATSILSNNYNIHRKENKCYGTQNTPSLSSAKTRRASPTKQFQLA